MPTEARFDVCGGDNVLFSDVVSLWVLPGTDIHAVLQRLTALLPPHVPQPQLRCVPVCGIPVLANGVPSASQSRDPKPLSRLQTSKQRY